MTMTTITITGFVRIRVEDAVAHNGFSFKRKGDNIASDIYTHLGINYPKFYKMDNLSRLGFVAAELLLQGRKITQDYPAASIAVVLSNAHASLDTDKRFADSMKTMASPALFVYTLPNIVAGEICIRHEIKGENAFFVSALFDAELMSTYVDMVMMQPGVNACLAGWVDVMGDHHDVFLYLTERNKKSTWVHTADQLNALYRGDYGKADG